jgi:hypothetical protein
MRYQNLLFITTLIFAAIFAGCVGSDAPAVNSNINKTANANANAAGNANNPLATTKAPEEQTTNQGATLTPVVKAYCDAMTRKDEAAIRKVYSQATLKSLEADMKADKKASLIEFLSEIDKVSNALCEVRNEKIEGDTAVAEVRTESYPNGIKIKFVREGGDWKMTNESPNFEEVKKSAANSNAK